MANLALLRGETIPKAIRFIAIHLPTGAYCIDRATRKPAFSVRTPGADA
jgi:hypothetical protein